MEFLSRINNQIKTRLKGLTFTEWAVIVLLMVVFAGASFWMVQYSAEQQMIPLLNQSFTEDQRARIVESLADMGETYTIEGDRIQVLKTRQRELLARLYSAEALPGDTSVGWQSIMNETDIWTPEQVRKDRNKIVLQMELQRVINNFPGVQKSTVFINTGDKRTLSNIVPAASASVSLIMESASVNRKKVASSVASLVSSASNRMRRENVKVIIDGVAVPVIAEGEEYASDLIELQGKWEEHYRTKIARHFAGLNPLVEVDVELKNHTSTETKKVFEDGKGSVMVPVESQSNETSSKNMTTQEEPGVQANVGAGDSASGETSSDTSEESTNKNTFIEGYEKTRQEIVKGDKNKITVSLSIPEYYFESKAKKDLGIDTDPTVEQIQLVKNTELPVFRDKVMAIIGQVEDQFDKHVVVDSYWTPENMPGTPGGVGSVGGEEMAQAGGTITGIAKQYGKQIAVGTLAMISLFMMLMMVRKASGPVDITEEEATMMMQGTKPLDALSAEDANIVDGDPVDGLLQGVEMDSSAIHSQQVLQQVRDLVTDAPDIAATLINKWMKQND